MAYFPGRQINKMLSPLKNRSFTISTYQKSSSGCLMDPTGEGGYKQDNTFWYLMVLIIMSAVRQNVRIFFIEIIFFSLRFNKCWEGSTLTKVIPKKRGKKKKITRETKKNGFVVVTTYSLYSFAGYPPLRSRTSESNDVLLMCLQTATLGPHRQYPRTPSNSEHILCYLCLDQWGLLGGTKSEGGGDYEGSGRRDLLSRQFPQTARTVFLQDSRIKGVWKSCPEA